MASTPKGSRKQGRVRSVAAIAIVCVLLGSVLLAAGVSIAHMFAGPSETPEDYLAAMSQLFPEHDPEKAVSLYESTEPNEHWRGVFSVYMANRLTAEQWRRVLIAFSAIHRPPDEEATLGHALRREGVVSLPVALDLVEQWAQGSTDEAIARASRVLELVYRSESWPRPEKPAATAETMREELTRLRGLKPDTSWQGPRVRDGEQLPDEQK